MGKNLRIRIEDDRRMKLAKYMSQETKQTKEENEK